MCVIVDANVAADVFASMPDVNFEPIHAWLFDKRKNGCLVFGGRLARELQSEKSRIALRTLNQAGRAIHIPDDQVDHEEKRLRKTKLCRSNDPHVIALARISGTRTLCCRDKDLQHDFTNRALIAKPPGKLYIGWKPDSRPNKRVLTHTSGCPYQRPQRRR